MIQHMIQEVPGRNNENGHTGHPLPVSIFHQQPCRRLTAFSPWEILAVRPITGRILPQQRELLLARHKWLNCNKAYVHVLILVAGLSLIGPDAAQAGYASFVVEADSGQVLHADSADAINHPASLTKMMTLYMLFEALAEGHLTLATPMKVSARAAAQSPSKLNLPPGATISVENTILALVTKSANDVACVVAETLGNSEAEFAMMMTATAHQLGMHNTVFRNASGLPNKAQVTTARDMATLGRALIRHHSRYYHYFSTRRFQYGEMNIPTHNRLLLSYEGADGIKTGYIAASGFNLVTSARQNGKRLIGVVLGGATARWRDAHMVDLLDSAFARLAGKPIAVAGRVPPLAQKATTRKAGDVSKAQTEAGRGTGRQAQLDAPVRRRALADSKPTAPRSEPGAARKTVTAAKAAPQKTTSATSSGDWGIQLGSFRKADQAQASATALMARLKTVKDKPSTVIVTAKVKNVTLYRARLMGMTQKEAHKACTRVPRTKDLPTPTCHVVHPTGELARTAAE
ncbi:MAG: serine-type D-Ala-D-Ala carboxypeptidase [Rhodospirillaceae bacterium]|nr:MAG: serine-type D-Ala-D-Ala carboxypeptidase [Rhodospirillaceae bacterium]